MKTLMLVATLFAGVAALETTAAAAAAACVGCSRASTHSTALQTGRSVAGGGKQVQIALLPAHPPLPPRRPAEFK